MGRDYARMKILHCLQVLTCMMGQENKRLLGLTLGSSYIYLGSVYAIGYRKTAKRKAEVRATA